MSEPLVLGFDTSAACCAGALLSGGRIVAERSEPMQRGQAERLIPLLEGLLCDAGVRWSDLSALGAGIGPGNFTGIRISVATARGLALSLGIPAVGVSAFEALRHGADGVVVASVRGPGDTLYIQVTGDVPQQCRPDTLPPVPPQGTPTVIGHRADEIAQHYGGRAAHPACSLPEAIARIAARRRSDAPPRPAPLYIRAASAAPPRRPPPVIAG